MARPRGQSFGEGLKIPHSVSLKVLRLTRPSLQTQYPLPHTPPSSKNGLTISPEASLAYPQSTDKDAFILTHILQLPESFQSAYVGETFSATLCANNELPASSNTAKSVSNVKVQAEILTPSSGSVGQVLELDDADEAEDGEEGRGLAPGETMQKVLKLSLKEEGNHTLGVTVTYTETVHGEGEGKGSGGPAVGAKVRTFRKLYQFVAMPLLGVRTKAGDVPGRRDGRVRYAVEAQVENLGERGVILETVSLSPKAPFTSQSLNWDVYGCGADPVHAPILNPRDVYQVAFLLEEQTDPEKTPKQEEAVQDIHVAVEKIILGQLHLQWTSAMGDRGSLSTGWLVAKKR